ncbi:MAG: hypothetical protein EBS29_07685, partial [Chloroflexia bacterium]|nr:hypothetical protein [Chloroflexia bacterium]
APAVATATSAPAVATATSAPAVATATSAPTQTSGSSSIDTSPRQPIAGGPTLLDSRIDVRRVTNVPVNSIRLVYDAKNSSLLMLTMNDGLQRITPADGQTTTVATTAEMVGAAVPSGLAVASDGTVYVVGNETVKTMTQAVIRRGRPNGAKYSWETVASTEAYPRSDTPFDHLFNGIVVSNKWIYVTSGSRTDHGEVETQNDTFPDLREAALTARMYRLAIDSKDIVLKNDEAAVAPYVYARGFRNAYDPAFAPNGELFVGDNGPDADLPDELNWVRQGGHFGFPWRFGDTDNPQRDPAYDPAKDLRLQPDFTAVQIGAYHNDPTYPAAPGKFLDPIINQGPAATNYRGVDGKSHDAAQEGKTLAGLTPHRSPLGLVFADQNFPKSWQGQGKTLNGFLLSWGAAGGTLPDRGQDMLALQLSKSGNNYTMTARQIVRDLHNPIDSAIVGDKIYVLEFGDKVAIWEFTFHE